MTRPAGRASVAAALFAGTALLYARVAGFAFTWFDDPGYVVENARVRAGLSLANVQWAFTTFHFSNWHPLTWLSYMLDVELFGVSPAALHLVNALLHAANAALLFLALERLTGARGRSAFVALLFAVHPLHVESVAWVAERKDVLSTLFGLLALLAYSGWVERRGAGRYALVTLAFAASLMAKPMWVTLPCLLLLLDLWPLGRAGLPAARERPRPAPTARPAQLLLEKVPWFALSAASAALTLLAQQRGGAVSGAGAGRQLGNALVSYARYLGSTFWPAGLAAWYPLPAGGHGAPAVAAAAALLLACSAAAVLSLRRQPWLAVGWAWFLGTLVPVIGLVQVGGQARADRYTYLPSIGLFVAVAWGAHAAKGRWPGLPLRAAGAAAAAALALLCWRQEAHWSDHLALFRHALAVTGPNARAHAYLSDGLRKSGRLEEAWAEAQAALELEPWAGRLWQNLALVEVDQGRLPEARRALRRAIELDARLALARALLGEVETALGDPARGEQLLAEAARLAPGDAEIADRLARVRAFRAASGR